MLNLNNYKFKTSIKIVAAFLILLQAIFLLQKVLAGSQSVLIVKPLDNAVGFNLAWNFTNNSTSAKYLLLKSNSKELSCPASPTNLADINGSVINSGANITIYNKEVSDIDIDKEYFFRACLYGSVLSGITNSFALVEETNTAVGIFSTAIIPETDTYNDTSVIIATTTTADAINDTNITINSNIETIASATDYAIINDNTVIATTTATILIETDESIIEDKKIALSNVGKDLYWRTSNYFASGYYVIWSKVANPIFRSGAVGVTYFSDPMAKFYTIKAYDGAGVYYVRVCEALTAGGCGVYSNQLNINLLAETTIVKEQISSTTLATSSIVKTVEPELTQLNTELTNEQLQISTTTAVQPTETREVSKPVPVLPVAETVNTLEKTSTDLNKTAIGSVVPIIKPDSPTPTVITANATSSQSITTEINNISNLPRICVENNILNEAACNLYFFKEATSEVQCSKVGDDCLMDTRDKYLSNISNKQIKLEAVEQVANKNMTRIMSIGKLKDGLNNFSDVVSLLDDETGVKILKSESRVSYQDDKIIQTGSSILVIDSDGDGLPDDIENKIGTDANNRDTDGDSYDDYAEYTSGYNPLGNGKLIADNKLAPVEIAIINDEIFEQPKISGSFHDDFSIDTVGNINAATTSGESFGYQFQGKATPNTVVTLYIYSDLPLMVTVKTDDYGNWKYELKQSLTDGDHEVYVALNDATGKVVAKSNALSFLIKEAKAASLADVVLQNNAPTIESETENIFIYYLLISGILVLLGVGTYLYLIKRKRNLNV